MNYSELTARYFNAAADMGIPYADADAVRRDAERVDTWNAHECNGAIQWAEDGDVDHRGRPLKAGRPYWVHGQDGPGEIVWTRRADTYTPAMARVRAFAERHRLELSYNADPRGWPFRFKSSDGREIAPPVRCK